MTRLPALPAYTVTVGKLAGAPYTTTTIKVGGIVIRSQLGPISDAMAREYVRAYLAPPPASRLDDVAAFLEADKKSLARSARGGRNKRPAPRVTDRGFIWSKEQDE
jgi:hypothetical protein